MYLSLEFDLMSAYLSV